MSKYKGYNEKCKEASMKYIKENREQICFLFPKGAKQRYKQYAKSKGKSVTKIFMELMEQAMKKDGFLK